MSKKSLGVMQRELCESLMPLDGDQYFFKDKNGEKNILLKKGDHICIHYGGYKKYVWFSVLQVIRTKNGISFRPLPIWRIRNSVTEKIGEVSMNIKKYKISKPEQSDESVKKLIEKLTAPYSYKRSRHSSSYLNTHDYIVI